MGTILLFLTFIICFGLSLGIQEGKQAAIALYWSLVLPIVISLFQFFLRKTNRKWNITKSLFYLLLATNGTFFLTMLFSQDVGYSISISIRMISAWLIFLFFSHQKFLEKEHRLLIYGLLVLGGMTSFVGVCARFIPPLANLLPISNLVFSKGGHNQGAYFIIFLLPLAISQLRLQKRSFWMFLLPLLYFLSIFMSFSRGAILLTIGYILYLLFSYSWSIALRRLFQLLLGVSIGLCILLFTYTLLPEQIRTTGYFAQITNSPITKTPPQLESRPALLLQAIQGFLHHPLVGTGPGTFIITSLRFRSRPSDGAPLAHSYPFQTISEYGLIGFIPIACCFYFLIKHLVKKYTQEKQKQSQLSIFTIGMIESIGIMMIFSCFEYVFDYFSIWLLFWAMVGILYQTKKDDKTVSISWYVYLGIVILLLYGSTSLISNRYWNYIQTKSIGYYLSFYDAERTVRYIEFHNQMNKPISNQDEQVITFIHRYTPDVLIAKANLKTYDTKTRNALYQQAIQSNPLNQYYVATAMAFAIDQNDLQQTVLLYTELVKRTYASLRLPHESTNDLTHPMFYPFYTKEFTSLLAGPGLLTESVSKTLYILGLNIMPNDQETTKLLWEMANTLSPGWSMFYIERAAFSYHVEHDSEEAYAILKTCQNKPSPSWGCAMYLIDFPTNIPPVGSLQEDILRIPGKGK